MFSISAEMQGIRTNEGLVAFANTDQFAVDPGRGLEPEGLRSALKTLGKGEYLLLADRFRVLGGSASAHLIEVDDFAKTRTESANQTYFGQLVLGDSFTGEHTEFVAVKPLVTHQKAAQEYGATVFVNDLEQDGQRPLSFVPLGFYREHTGKTSLITRYDHSVKSLDNVFWNPDRTPTDEEAMFALQYCAASLGYLHSNRLTHGDPQIKNMAVDNEGVRYIDLTDTELVQTRENPFYVRERISAEIRGLLSSLNSRSEDPDRDFVEAIRAGFVDQYTDFVAESDLPDEAKLTTDDVMLLAA